MFIDPHSTRQRNLHLCYCFRILTGKPRLAGTENNRESGDFVHRQFLQYGLQSELIEYNVTLSYPDKTADNYVSGN